MDEFSSDIVIAAGEFWLAYDVTWIGNVKNLSVWEKQPTKDELLAARLTREWQPTFSDLAAGQRILGYAACLVSDITR